MRNTHSSCVCLTSSELQKGCDVASKCWRSCVAKTSASAAEAQAMQARLLRTDHSLLLTRNSTLRFRSGSFTAVPRQERCRSSNPRPLIAKVQQRPDAGRPEWRQRTDQVSSQHKVSKHTCNVVLIGMSRLRWYNV